MTLASRTQALLDLVEADRKLRCEAIARDARARADELTAAAHAEARRRVRSAFAEERRRLEARLAAAKARLMTHRRLHDQRRAGDLLAAGWQTLAAALCARWQEPESRQAWIGKVIAEARRVLPRDTWRITYAPGWQDDEREGLAKSLSASLGVSPQFAEDDAAHAGLRVSAGGNAIDGTLSGLSADRTEIGGRLLGTLEGET